MTASQRQRVFHYGLCCLSLGWIGAGANEWAGGNVWTALLTLLILMLVVAAVADAIARGGGT